MNNNASKPLAYGLVGCGMMGREHIRNIQLLDNTTVTAIFEPDAAMREAAREFAPNAIYTESLSELLNIESLDCLVIVSPNYLHTDNLREIMAENPLPLLVEKPLFTDIDDDAFIQSLINDYPAPVWVAMEYRYMPPLAEFIKQSPSVTGGISLLTIREHRFPFLEKAGDWNRFNRYSGGTFVEKCCHFFDLMRFILQSEPVSIMASAGQSHNHLDETYNSETPDIWDNGFVIVNFENGTRALLELCMFAEGSRYQEEICAVGKDGKIECRIPGPSRFWTGLPEDEPIPNIVTSPRSPKGPIQHDIPVEKHLLAAGDHHGSTFYQHQHFQQVVLGNESPQVTLSDGRKAVLMGMAAQESARTGQTVTL